MPARCAVPAENAAESREAARKAVPAAGAGAPPEDPTICVMDLDRPFLFLIRTGDTVLFVGVVESPKA